MDEIKLKLCPFCGGEAAAIWNGAFDEGNYWVRCWECGADPAEVVAVFLVLVIILLVCLYLNAHYRFWLIRATLHSPLPGWLKTVLWGWW